MAKGTPRPRVVPRRRKNCSPSSPPLWFLSWCWQGGRLFFSCPSRQPRSLPRGTRAMKKPPPKARRKVAGRRRNMRGTTRNWRPSGQPGRPGSYFQIEVQCWLRTPRCRRRSVADARGAHALIRLLSSKTAEELSQPEGKEKLAKEVEKAVNEVLGVKKASKGVKECCSPPSSSSRGRPRRSWLTGFSLPGRSRCPAQGRHGRGRRRRRAEEGRRRPDLRHRPPGAHRARAHADAGDHQRALRALSAHRPVQLHAPQRGNFGRPGPGA